MLLCDFLGLLQIFETYGDLLLIGLVKPLVKSRIVYLKLKLNDTLITFLSQPPHALNALTLFSK